MEAMGKSSPPVQTLDEVYVHLMTTTTERRNCLTAEQYFTNNNNSSLIHYTSTRQTQTTLTSDYY